MKISIITVVYNNKHTIKDAIESVIFQDYEEIEYIVIDGGSTDGTIEIINSYQKNIDVFISEKDDGIYDALNKGIQAATGDIVGFLHSDDIYNSKDVLSKIANSFELQENLDSVYGDLVYVSNNNTNRITRKWISSNFSLKKLEFGWMPPHPSLFIKKEIYQKYGMFDTNLKIAADYDLILRFFGKNKITTKYIPGVLVKMRWGGVSNNNISNILLKTKEDIATIKRNKIGNITTVFFKNARKLPQFFAF